MVHTSLSDKPSRVLLMSVDNDNASGIDVSTRQPVQVCVSLIISLSLISSLPLHFLFPPHSLFPPFFLGTLPPSLCFSFSRFLFLSFLLLLLPSLALTSLFPSLSPSLCSPFSRFSFSPFFSYSFPPSSLPFSFSHTSLYSLFSPSNLSPSPPFYLFTLYSNHLSQLSLFFRTPSL